MSTLSSREVSLSAHAKRRSRSSAALSSYVGGGSDAVGGSSNNSRPPPSAQHHHRAAVRGIDNNSEGGYDSHAASYGNYDAPSYRHCRSYGASEHGCYAAESHIGHGGYSRDEGDRPTRAVIRPSRTSYATDHYGATDALDDLEGQRSEDEMMPSSYRDGGGSRRRPPRHRSDHALRLSQASTVPMGPVPHPSEMMPRGGEASAYHWEEESSCYYPKSHDPSSLSCCPSVAGTASTAGSSGSSSLGSGSGVNSAASSSGNSVLEEEAIRQGIVDVATLLATYIAGGLSFVIGILLTLVSPFVKVVKVVVGDVRGLLGDAGFLRELGSLWDVYRELRRRGGRSSGGDGRGERAAGRRQHDRHRAHYHRYQDDESADPTVYSTYSEQSDQFVGGWAPRFSPSVGGSAAAASADNASGAGGRSSWRRSSSRGSHSSLPLVCEDRCRERQRHGPRDQVFYPSPDATMYPPRHHRPQQQHRAAATAAPYHHPDPSYYAAGHPSSPVRHGARPCSEREYSPMTMRSPHPAAADCYGPQKTRHMSRSRSGVV